MLSFSYACLRNIFVIKKTILNNINAFKYFYQNIFMVNKLTFRFDFDSGKIYCNKGVKVTVR
jgi:hypothetical protein